jgi:hypothetical protein
LLFLLDQKERFEVAKISVHKNAGLFVKYKDHYNLTQEQKFEIAKIIAEKDFSQALIKMVETENFTQEQKFEIFKTFAIFN